MTDYIINLIKNKKDAIISSLDSESNMIYYKFMDKTIDVTVKIPNTDKKFRKTKRFFIINESEIDIKKIKIAIKPN
jgi:hypothetical protein